MTARYSGQLEIMRTLLKNRLLVSAIVLQSLVASSQGQGSLGIGTFQDLDFEQSTLASPGPTQWNSVGFASAFPGWSGLIGSQPASQAGYNGYSTGATVITLQTPNAKIPFSINYPVIDGRFSAFLEGSDLPAYDTATLAQTGTVPIGSESLQMKIGTGHVGNFTVTVGGTPLSMMPLSSTSAYTLLAGDIRGFGGMTAQLAISIPGRPGPTLNDVLVDDIIFSSQIVPEPGTGALWSLGGLMMGGFALGKSR